MITGIRLISHGDNEYAPQPPFNLSVDTPPLLGDPFWSVVRIAKSDGAEGIVEFEVEEAIRVKEEAGEVTVPLVKCFSFHYYTRGSNEWRGPPLRLSAYAIQLLRNLAAVASRWRHCAGLTGPEIEPQTSRTDSVCLTIELTGRFVF